ncbi:MAG TPA: hypothetical protein VGV89_00130 [Thermoplasmata archaeon]|nr:hypothetical protein [Thermoplasmata archaeon]
MSPRLHRGGRFRLWLGTHFGGGYELGDRLWRRVLHGLGALVVVYYLLPDRFFVVVSTEQALLIALGVMLVLEGLRHLVRLELPTVRAIEKDRVASFAYFATALVIVVVLFPVSIAVVAAVGSSLVDPLIGELRLSSRYRRLYPAFPLALYAGIAMVALGLLADWSLVEVVVLGVGAAVIAVAVEWPKHRWLDDDLTMTLAPALFLLAARFVWPA